MDLEAHHRLVAGQRLVERHERAGLVAGHREHLRGCERAAPLLEQQPLERRGGVVEPVVGLQRREELDADGQAVLGQAGGQREAGHAGQVGRDGGDVLEVHRQRVVELLPQPERRRRRRRRHEHVDLGEGRVEVARHQRPDLLRRAVVGVVVAAGQRVGAEDDAALDLVAEAGVAARGHHLLGARVVDALGEGAQAVAHRVEAGEVGRHLARHHQVVGRQRLGEAGARDLDDRGAGRGQQLDGLVEARLHAGLEALAATARAPRRSAGRRRRRGGRPRPPAAPGRRSTSSPSGRARR